MKSPFNSPRDPALPPYHLRNGVSKSERTEIDNYEAEHRRRLGMSFGCPHCETMAKTIEAQKLEIAELKRLMQAAQS